MKYPMELSVFTRNLCPEFSGIRRALAAIAIATSGLGTAAAQNAFVPVTDAMLQNPDAADWPTTFGAE